MRVIHSSQKPLSINFPEYLEDLFTISVLFLIPIFISLECKIVHIIWNYSGFEKFKDLKLLHMQNLNNLIRKSVDIKSYFASKWEMDQIILDIIF